MLLFVPNICMVLFYHPRPSIFHVHSSLKFRSFIPNVHPSQTFIHPLCVSIPNFHLSFPFIHNSFSPFLMFVHYACLSIPQVRPSLCSSIPHIPWSLMFFHPSCFSICHIRSCSSILCVTLPPCFLSILVFIPEMIEPLGLEQNSSQSSSALLAWLSLNISKF